MPIPSENVEVLLAGLDQKTSAKITTPGRLERARNVEFDKQGELSKRVGYLMLETTQVDGVTVPDILARLAVDGDELLVFSQTYAFALVDPTEGLQSATRGLVQRGPVSFGNVSTFSVVVSMDMEA